MILPDAATARALRTQPEIARATSRYPDVTKAVVGLGAWEAGQSTVADAVSERERREQHELGVRAETCGIQLDADGNAVTTPLTERIIGIDAEQLRGVPDVIAFVYGTRKAGAVEAAVRGGIANSLATHTSLARELLARA
jgi:DNA-binding transcriptional regulator LsrR (DeoR family)